MFIGVISLAYLKSPDLLPISEKERKITPLGYSFMWVGMVVVLATFAIGGTGVMLYHYHWYY